MAEDRAGTEPPLLTNDAVLNRLEYLHTEAKGFRSTQVEVNHAIEKRIAELEFEAKNNRERMNTGAATFAKLEAQIERVNAKIDWPWYKTLGMIMPAILLALTWAWAAAHYPDEGKFEALRNEVQEFKLQQATENATQHVKWDAVQATMQELGKKIDDLRSRP